MILIVVSFMALRPMICPKHTLILGQDARGRAAMPTDLADLYRKNPDDCRHNQTERIIAVSGKLTHGAAVGLGCSRKKRSISLAASGPRGSV